MTRNEFLALVLRATEDTLDMLEGHLRQDEQRAALGGAMSDPAANTVLHALDQLVFALVRYRAEHRIPQR